MSSLDVADAVERAGSQARRRRTMDRVKVWGVRLGGLAAVLLAWWWAAGPGGVSPLLLPEPRAVAEELPDLLTSAATWRHLRLTGLEVVAAFGISLAAGFGLGFWAGRDEYRTLVVEPLLISAYMIPIVLLYPVALLMFGIGPMSKIVFAGVYGFFPVALNTMKGFRTVDQRLIAAAVSMGATPRQLTWLVRLPAAMPLIMSGVRIAAALNLIGVIVGEMLGARAGLGYEIARTTSTFAIPKLYSYIVLSLVLIVVFNRVVTRTEDRQRPGRLDI